VNPQVVQAVGVLGFLVVLVHFVVRWVFLRRAFVAMKGLTPRRRRGGGHLGRGDRF